jgi:WD40 repeat protein
MIWPINSQDIFLEGHLGIVSNLIKLENGNLVSGSCDGMIRIWNNSSCDFDNLTFQSLFLERILSLVYLIQDFFMVYTIDGYLSIYKSNILHSKLKISKKLINTKVSKLPFILLSDDSFALSTFNSNILIWNFTEKRSTQTLEGHKDWVSCLIKIRNNEQNSDRFASGSLDNTIRIWCKFENNYITQTILYLNDYVNTLLYVFENKLISASRDNIIKVWNLERTDINKNTNEFICELKGHEDTITQLICLNNGYLASGSIDKSVIIWNIQNQSIVQRININYEVFSLISLSNGNLAIGTNQFIKIIDKSYFDSEKMNEQINENRLNASNEIQNKFIFQEESNSSNDDSAINEISNVNYETNDFLINYF